MRVASIVQAPASCSGRCAAVSTTRGPQPLLRTMRLAHAHRHQVRSLTTTVVQAASTETETKPESEVGVQEVNEEQEEEIKPQLVDVEELCAIRLEFDSNAKPRIEYLVKWKDDDTYTWEPTYNLSEDLLRDYEEGWWTAIKKNDIPLVGKYLKQGGEIIANCVDYDGRTALHFAAALGNAPLVDMLIKAGSDPDVQDKEGYTPLHMSTGYLHTAPSVALLQAGAKSELEDKTGRDVVALIDSLRDNMENAGVNAMPQRLALEDVAKAMTASLYDEVEPLRILEVRKNKRTQKTEYLVQWSDGEEDEWVEESLISQDILDDMAAGLEFAAAEEVLDVKKKGFAKYYLVKWSDGEEPSWEVEENVSELLVAQFNEKQEGSKSQTSKAEKAPAMVAQ